MIHPLLLIIDDEKSTRDGLRMGLEGSFDIYTASNLTEAKTILETEPIDAILTDLRLGGESGMDILTTAQKLANPPTCIMMTAYGSVDAAVEAMKRGAYHFVTKPLNLDEVEILLKRALRSRGLESENKQLQSCINPSQGLEKLLGKSPAMETIFQQIRQIAPTKATVLIEGESGTGKELVGAAIHTLSGRPQEKLVIVNCAALSSQLLESELFGHEKGSFTGASQRRIGRFEQANGGTLILDEIGEIDATTQVKLLRALSEKTIERVGSNTPIKIDVRLIAATNKSLKELVHQGNFREDLYFRLNVVSIHMPPLRERKEDIVLLSNSFLREFAKENNRPFKPLADSAMKMLLAYQWPGNVRELRTVIEHGVVMSNDSIIDSQHLPQFIQETNLDSLLLSAPPALLPESLYQHPLCSTSSSEKFNLQELERQAIFSALKTAKGNRSLAAQWLGISRRTLQRKLSDYTISTYISPSHE